MLLFVFCAGGVKPEGHTDSHDVIDMRSVIIPGGGGGGYSLIWAI